MYHGIYNRLRVRTWASDRDVIRAIRRKLASTAFTRDNREARHDAYRAILDIHHKWQDTAARIRF